MSTYGYYLTVTWCVAFLPGLIEFCFFIVIVTALVAIPWYHLKKNNEENESPLKSLNGGSQNNSKDDQKKKTCCFKADAAANAEGGAQDNSEDDQNKQTCCCWRCKCTCELWKLMLRGMLQLTERASHFLFETDSLNIIPSEKHGRVLVISGRKFKLTFKVLWCIIMYNCIVIGIISLVAMNYLVVHETLGCNENLDCFLEKDTSRSSQPIENCTEYETTDDVIRCYSIAIRPAVVLALVGGFLKIVPPFIFYVTTTLFLILLKNVHWRWKLLCNAVLAGVFSLALMVVAIFTGVRVDFLSFIYESEERSAQTLAFFLLCYTFTCWPWYIMEDAEEKPLNDKNKDKQSKETELEETQLDNIEDRPLEDNTSERHGDEREENVIGGQ